MTDHYHQEKPAMKSIYFASSLALALATTAQAQTSDSGTADAVAELEAAVIPLQVNGVTTLNFGAIRIPNGLVAGNRCSYFLGASHPTSVATNLRELSSTGAVTDSSFPTSSGCELSGTAQVAQFDVTCSAATPTQFSATWTNAGEIGVTFRQPVSTNRFLLAAFPDGGNASSQLQNSLNSTLNVNCPNNGALDLYVGGEVVLEPTARSATEVTVGTITLSANY
jgi:hypothetical protein